MTDTSDLLSDVHLHTIGRFRTACTTAALGGAAVSMAANVLASDGTPVGWAVGLTAPAAFILASEIAALAMDLPSTRGARFMLRAISGLLVLIGGSAAVVSFGHIREVVAGVGESEIAEVLLAITIDAVAVMGLIGRHLTSMYVRRHEAAAAAKAEADRIAAESARAEAEHQAQLEAEAEARRAERAAKRADRRTKATAKAGERVSVAGDDPSLTSAERVVAIAGANPEMTQAELAAVVGVGERTVRRYLSNARNTHQTETQTDNTTRIAGGADRPGGDAVDGSVPDEDHGDEPGEALEAA